MKSNKLIFIIEDEDDIAELISVNLRKSFYQALIFNNANDALLMLSKVLPDLIILDLMLPDINGLDFCSQIKNQTKFASIPVVMVTARGSEEDIIRGLEFGAYDYITKPFAPKVLIARINNILKRVTITEDKNIEQNILSFNNIKIDTQKREISIEDKVLDLTFLEFQLIYFLAQKPGMVLTRDQIIEHTRGQNHNITNRSIDVQIVTLRKKMLPWDYIETVRGVGYRFKEML
ncbi:MAG: response regulator transcription factor [Oligoflexia bacterium]|nr:response regulator transcription factor [Oligoflexia bacterium]